MANVDMSKWLLPVATALGAWGGFPQPPAFFTKLTQNELFQYAMLFVLLWQGGSGQDVQIAAIVTLAFYILTKVMSKAM